MLDSPKPTSSGDWLKLMYELQPCLFQCKNANHRVSGKFFINLGMHGHSTIELVCSDNSYGLMPPKTLKSMPVVGGASPELYHTETVPCTHPTSSNELERFQNHPHMLVGRKFSPPDAQDVWDVTEARYSKKGWTLLMEFEAKEGTHEMECDDFIAMLRNGILVVVDLP
ncbi:hypothetical protein B0H34DRAFT_473292 [Crassisporium funariophilum]|nr:hypothetical protein B0H34DRAFT_473292 [Crassisporium funariophilum]